MKSKQRFWRSTLALKWSKGVANIPLELALSSHMQCGLQAEHNGEAVETLGEEILGQFSLAVLKTF